MSYSPKTSPAIVSPKANGRTVAILGAGNMGTALAHLLASNGQHVHLWTIDVSVLNEVREQRYNSKYLPGIKLHSEIEPKSVLQEALAGVWLIIFAVPSQAVREVAVRSAPFVEDAQAVLNAAKGLELTSRLRMSQVLAEEMSVGAEGKIATMGGPAIAPEMAREQPLALVVAASDAGVSGAIQAAMENEFLKVETTGDLCGVEMGSTLKNIYAIALGMCDGLEWGANTKAFLASVALAEMITIAHAMGAREETLFSLAGLGDLLTTGYSAHSRNRTLGEKMASGSDWKQFLNTHTVEGVDACQSVGELVKKKLILAPLLGMVSGVLIEERPAADGLRQFLREFSYQK